ncbi:MAG: hypothetical protein ACRD22_06450, partial [Terriglobia bacterium]
MRSWRVSLGMCFVAWLFAGGLAPFSGPGGTRLCAAETTVTLVRLPDRGYQQQVVDDAKGVIHVVYVKGDAESADIFYTRLEPGAARFTPALRVNSQAACATALGTIRGPAIAL